MRSQPDTKSVYCLHRTLLLSVLCLAFIAFNGVFAETSSPSFSHVMPPGWNLFSTPIALETGYDRIPEIMDPIEGIDLVLAFEGTWYIPNDTYRVKPLEALAIKADRPVTATIVPSHLITTLPTRDLPQGLSLVGPAPAPEEGVFSAMPLDQALISVRQAPDGKEGYIMVVSPAMNQPGWGYARGGTIHDLLPFAGYWLVMESPDTLIGFSTTPLQETPARQVVWLDYSDAGGYDRIQKMAGNGELVFTAGEYVTSGRDTQFAVRAYEEGGDTPAWSYLSDSGDGKDIAYSVDAVSGYVAAVGSGVDTQGNTLFVVKVLDATTGEELWEDAYDNGGGWNEAYDVVILGGSVMAVGTGRTADGTDEFLARTYDLATGDLSWSDANSGGGGENAALCAASSTLGLFAGGYIETPDGNKQFCVRAYNPMNGAVLWSDAYDRGSGNNRVRDIDCRNGYVVAAGEGGLPNASVGLLVRCYDALDGGLAWQKSDPASDASADNIVLSDDRAFVSGMEPGAFFVRSYDLASGDLAWNDAISNDGWFNFITGVDYEDGLLTVALFDQWITPEDLEYRYALAIRGYNAETGVLLAQEDETGTGLAGGLDILIHGNAVYVGGPWFGLVSIAGPGPMASAPANRTVVTTSGREILINGEPFYVRGINYQPSPVGSDNSWDPFGDWYQDYWISIPTRDLPQIKAMNGNAVKTYAITAWSWSDPSKSPISHALFYQLLEENGMYAVPMVYTQESSITGFSNTTWQNDPTMQQWLAILAEGKDQPGVLGWCVGNELNAEDLLYPQYWQNYNAIVGIIKNASPDKITVIGVVDDSMATPDFADQYMTSLDVWGINSYRGNLGAAFDDMFITFREASNKPLLITEWGPPSSTRNASGAAVELPSNALATADYIEVHWHNDTYQQGYDSMFENNATCQGGFLFEWTDEWNKIAPPTAQNPSTSQNINFPGGWWDEEWFGMNSIQVSGRDPANPDPGNPDILIPRAAVARMQSLWAGLS